MGFTVVIESAGTFTAEVNGSTFDVSPQSGGTFDVGITQIGPKGDQGEPGEPGSTGAKGDKGDTGDSGIVYATSPITYDGVTKTVAFDQTAENTAIESALANGSILPNSIRLNAIAFGTTGVPTIQNEAFSTSLLSPYLLSATAASTYYPLTNPSSYITSAALSPYLLSSTAASTYFPIPTGTVSQYIAGNGTLVTFPTVFTANKITATVSNQTGSTLLKGQVVYINGAHGNLPTVALSQANAESTSAGTYGFISENIANNASGTIIIAGVAENLDTQALADGDKLYLSHTVAGGYTTTKPVAPNHMVYLGVVTRSHPTQGTIQLRIQNGFETDELHDALITSKTDKDLFTYEASSGLWKNKSFATLDLLTGTAAASTYYLASNPSAYVNAAGALAAVPDATTSTKGKAALATSAEAIAGTDTAKAVTSKALFDASPTNLMRDQYLSSYGAWGSLVTGMTVVQSGTERSINTAPSNAIGSAMLYQYGFLTTRGTSQNSGINWSKRVVWAMRLIRYNTPTAGSVFRTGIGKTQAGIAAGDLSGRGIGVRIQASGILELQVHNGTTLTNVSSSYTPNTSSTFDIELDSDGYGNVILYVDGVQVASTSQGPTGSSTFLWNTYFEVQQLSAVTLGGRYGFVTCRATFFD